MLFDGGFGILFLILLLLGKRNDRAPKSNPAGNGSGKSFLEAWQARVRGLLPRALAGARWAPRMEARLPGAGAEAARWIGIESGGNPRASSRLGERGLAQVMRKSLKDLGMTDADFERMIDPATTDDQHADLAAKVILGSVSRALRVAPQAAWGDSSLGVGKLRHGLPLLLRELAEQGMIRPTIAQTIIAARQGFRPSTRLAAFAGKQHAVTGRTVDDLLIRFLGSAAVVAHGDDALDLFKPIEVS